MGVSLYTSRIVLEALGVSDFGLYNVVGGVVSMFGFFNMAMTSATQRFFSFEIGTGDFNKLKKIFSSSLTVHFGIALVIMLFAETLGLWFVNFKLNIDPDRINAANWVYQFTILTFMISVVRVPYTAMMIAKEQMKIYSLISMLEVILKLAIVLLLMLIFFDRLITYAFFVFLVTLITTLTFKIYSTKKYPECKYYFHSEKGSYANLLTFSSWSLFGNLAAVTRGQGSNMILNLFFGTIINAAYGISSQVRSAVQQFVSSFQVALNPQIVQSYARGDLKEHQKIIFQGVKLSSFLLILIISPIWLNIDFILKIWLKSPPEYTAIFVRLALINTLIDAMSGPLIISAQATGKIKWYQIVIGLIMLLDMPITYVVLLNIPNPEYSYFVTISITCVTFVVRLFFLRYLSSFPIMTFIKEILVRILLIVILNTIAIFLIIKYTSLGNILFEFLSTSIIIIVLNIIAIILIGLSKSESKQITKIINEKIFKKY